MVGAISELRAAFSTFRDCWQATILTWSMAIINGL
ncbi:unnamed protein product [Tuber aestivum]|uniref:Uncharacterized protein n=1 Tax=Tuber aestivum TaxID=59557 RepID=A0A292Q6Q5_9PEZI|nr:unnamed protein product [Tuber aestivum]